MPAPRQPESCLNPSPHAQHSCCRAARRHPPRLDQHHRIILPGTPIFPRLLRRLHCHLCTVARPRHSGNARSGTCIGSARRFKLSCNDGPRGCPGLLWWHAVRSSPGRLHYPGVPQRRFGCRHKCDDPSVSSGRANGDPRRIHWISACASVGGRRFDVQRQFSSRNDDLHVLCPCPFCFCYDVVLQMLRVRLGWCDCALHPRG